MAEVGEGSVVDGRYRVLSRIGSGGMADVWCAEDSHLQRRVALKVLYNRFAQDREFVERFRREAEAAAGLQHPNVVGVFDRGDVDGTYYIAMEFLEGRSLAELIDAGLSPNAPAPPADQPLPAASAAGLPQDEAVRIVRQILEAARFAHRHGVIHRDLKPQNVIVDAEGHATVTDFGIARAGASEITQTGSVMGTAHYLSPEQAQGLEVGATSDLYSVGAMLYETLTGRVPFEGESAVTVALKQVSQTPQRPSASNPAVSPALDAVVMRALEKEPSRRFQDAEAFIAALDAAAKDPSAPVAGTTEFAPPPPVVAPVPVAAEESPADQRSEEEERRSRRWLLLLIAVILGLLAGLALTRDTTTEVRGVTDEQLDTALRLLEQDGFQVGEISRVQRDRPAGVVLEQDPSGEASLDCALLSFFCDKPDVNLTVSAGPGNAVVPDVIGLELGAAEQRLQRRDLGVQVLTEASRAVAEGIVIRSDPGRGETVQRGSPVTLTVSSGPRQVTVPALIDLRRRTAVARISERGLVASVTESESDRPLGTVISQSPDPGSTLEEGSPVSIVVSAGAPTVKVPGLVGQTRADAVAELRSRGLRPVVTERQIADEERDGLVVQQSPTGGTEVDEGAEVSIVIGDFIAPAPPPVAPRL